MTVLQTITTLQEFGECIKRVSLDKASGRFSIPGKGGGTYDELIKKFESLIPEAPLPGDRALARNIFTHLKDLAGSPDRMESIRGKLLYTKEEKENIDRLFTAMLPKLFEENPSAAAKLILADRDARVVAERLKSGDSTMFALAESIGKWEERSGIDFDKRFTIEEHETNCPAIFEKRLADWVEADNHIGRNTAAERIRAAYKSGENTVLDLRDLQLTTIPGVIEAIPNLQRLHLDNGAVLQNPKVIQHLPRGIVLDLIKANHIHFQYASRALIDKEFIFDALSRNGAVLQYLRKEKQCDREFLLEAVNRAPGVLAYVPESIKSDKEFMLSLVNAFAFGKDKWVKYYGAVVDDPPPLPDDIVDILCSNDPFESPKKVAEMYDLTFRPATVNEKPLNLITFEELAKAPIAGSGSGYDYFSDEAKKEHGAASPAKGEWLLIRKDVIPGSRSQTYRVQKELVEAKSLEVPDLLSATVGILSHYTRTGEQLFSDDPWTYMRCKEAIGQYAVGGFTLDGLLLVSYPTSTSTPLHVGVGALRKFS